MSVETHSQPAAGWPAATDRFISGLVDTPVGMVEGGERRREVGREGAKKRLRSKSVKRVANLSPFQVQNRQLFNQQRYGILPPFHSRQECMYSLISTFRI